MEPMRDMQALTESAARREPGRRPAVDLPDRLDEAALAALDEAARGEPFTLDLLRTAPARDMRLKIEAIVALLERMDVSRMLARQGPIARLTGADVEARLEFELAGQAVSTAVDDLRRAARNGQRIRALLAQGRAELMQEQERLDAVIAQSHNLLATARDADEFVRVRFERRLSNIMAMHAANVLTLQQIDLAEQVLAGLLDRFTDVETLLLPLWERNVLALAHAVAGKAQRVAAGTFEETNDRLIAYLRQETDL